MTNLSSEAFRRAPEVTSHVYPYGTYEPTQRSEMASSPLAEAAALSTSNWMSITSL